MKKGYLLTLTALLAFNFHSFSQIPTLAEDADGILNATRIYTQTSSGQVFFQGHQIGNTYSFPYGIFRAITDNPTGVSNYFYDGVANGITNFSVRADGQGYFAGNVGIGTTNPAEALDVNGNPVFGTATQRLSMGSNSLAFNRKVATGAIYDNTHFAYQFQHTGSTSQTSDYLALQVYNPSGGQITSSALTVNGAAQVGINTSYIPSAFQFAVNGGMMATSVTVQLKSAWPDYVFNKDYQLPSLNDVKTYINQNHHLPEMPSEQEVAKDGLNLGEMNKILTKKVEELTLYLIEKDRQIKDLTDSQQEEKRIQNEKLKRLEDRLGHLETTEK